MFIPISTTNTIAGAEVVQHKGLVSSSSIIGTGLLTDFVTSISEGFSGRTSTSEYKTERIYNTIIDNLKLKAKKLNANAIVGLKIDFDEVNIKAVHAFNICGVGTAVNIEFNDSSVQNSSSISGETIKSRILEQRVNDKIKLLELSSDDIDDEELDNILKAAINNNLNINLQGFLSILFSNPRMLMTNELIKSLSIYIGVLDSFDVNSAFFEVCYKLYQSNRISFNFLIGSTISGFIKDNLSVEYKSISNYIDKFPVCMWRGMFYTFLVKYKEQYKADDISYIDEICNKLKEPPKEKFPITEQKRGKRKWDCICGQSNSIDKEVCSCSLDKYGWSKEIEKRTAELLRHLNNIKQILEENLA